MSSGCTGSKHKQDRHNCSLMLAWKLYLSDLEQWRIQITGSHVPVDSKVMWTLPIGDKERLDEDTRDLILAYSEKETVDNEIRQVIAQKRSFSSACQVPSAKKIKRFIVNKKRKQATRDQNVRESHNKVDDPEPSTSHTAASTSSFRQPDMVTGSTVEESVGNYQFLTEHDAQDGSADYTLKTDGQVAVSNIVLGSDTNEHIAAATNDGTYVFAYVGGEDHSGPLCAFYNGSTAQQTAHGNLPDLSTFSGIMKEQKLGLVETSAANHLGYMQSSSGLPINTQDISLLSVPISQAGSIESYNGSQPMTVLSHMAPRVTGVPFIGIDQDGQPCYPNLSDLVLVCPPDTNIPQ